MADQQEQPALSSAFPPPPPFWQSFTPENITAIKELRALRSGSSKELDPAKSLPERILDLPAELRCLQPPEPPEEGKFRCFGDVYDLRDPLPTLSEMGVQQVYTPPSSPPTSPGPNNNTKLHHDRAFILKRIAKSLLLNFLELVGIMSTNPSMYVEKVADIRTLLVNFHHLLNEYRPHQARESVILMMRERVEAAKKEVAEIREVKARVESVLSGLGVGVDSVMNEGDESVREEDLEVWEALAKEFGGAD